MADPPVYTLMDLKTRITLMDVFDAHEMLDLKGAMNEKARENAGTK
jgi:hypothetical protein